MYKTGYQLPKKTAEAGLIEEAKKYKSVEEWVDKQLMEYDEKGIGINKYTGDEHADSYLHPDDFGNMKNYYELHIISKEGHWKDGHPEYNNIKNPIIRFRLTERNDGSDLMIEEAQMPNMANRKKMPNQLKNRGFDIGLKKLIIYAKDKGYNSIVLPSGEKIVVGFGMRTANKLPDFYDIIIKGKINKILGGPTEEHENFSFWMLDETGKKAQITDIYNKAHETKKGGFNI